jgi:hypothetical protein
MARAHDGHGGGRGHAGAAARLMPGLSALVVQEIVADGRAVMAIRLADQSAAFGGAVIHRDARFAQLLRCHARCGLDLEPCRVDVGRGDGCRQKLAPFDGGVAHALEEFARRLRVEQGLVGGAQHCVHGREMLVCGLGRPTGGGDHPLYFLKSLQPCGVRCADLGLKALQMLPSVSR